MKIKTWIYCKLTQLFFSMPGTQIWVLKLRGWFVLRFMNLTEFRLAEKKAVRG